MKASEPKSPMPSEVFTVELARTRERKSMTQEQLAERLSSIGAPIDRSTVGKIEADRRKVMLDELFEFAVALGVSPQALLVPRSENYMKVAPNMKCETSDVVYWLRNLYPLAASAPDDSDLRFFEESRADFEANSFRRFPNLLGMQKLMAALVTLGGSKDARDKKLLVKTAKILIQFLERLIESAGGGPDLPGDLLDRPVPLAEGRNRPSRKPYS